jgi:hypothetical protein
MNCPNCGKFMRLTDVTWDTHSTTYLWRCKCGKCKETKSEYGEFFSRDAFVFIGRKDDNL